MAESASVGLLADGSNPASPGDLLGRLAKLGIDTRTVEHPPVFTVEEAKKLRGEIEGCHTKNLFLRNKKGKMWLLVCSEDLSVNLKELGERLGAGRLSFGSADRLMKYLGVIPGAVTPFAIINDRQGKVGVALDKGVIGDRSLNFHPLDNAQTTSIGANDLIKFLDAEGHPARILDLSRPWVAADPRVQ